MSRKILVILLVAIAVLTWGALEYLFIEDTTHFDMSAQVIKITGPETKIGFAAQISELNFGRLPLGGRSTKFIDVSNQFNSPAKLRLVMSGNITPFLDLSSEEMILGPLESGQISVCFNSREMGNYSGDINIICIFNSFCVFCVCAANIYFCQRQDPGRGGLCELFCQCRWGAAGNFDEC